MLAEPSAKSNRLRLARDHCCRFFKSTGSSVEARNIMADDARISTAFPRHPKTVKLRRRLGLDGCWHLVCLFLWVAENRPDGSLEGMSHEDIEIAAGWTGEAGKFVEALVDVRFLDGQEGCF